MTNASTFSNRWTLGIAASLVAGTLALSGCTSSGSTDSSPNSGSPTGTPSVPIDKSLASIAKKNPMIYAHVSARQAKQLERIAVRAPGVQSVGYIPSTKIVQVYLTKSATTKQRYTAAQVVNQVLHTTAQPKPSTTTTHRKKHR